MRDPRIGPLLLRTARRLTRPGPPTPDAALLGRYARGRDPAAFAELMDRHGPAVWALCRRLLRSEADAEDAFQATFLVLARDAGRVRKAASVGSWLYGVASRLARRTRSRTGRRPVPAPRETAPDPADDLTWAEARAALDEELARLPDGLRAPLLLCYFDGLTQDEAAAELGWNPRTVKARVARGRDLLRVRLARRGVGLPAALATPLLSAGIDAAVPPRVIADLGRAAENVAHGRPPDDGASPAAAALARTEVAAGVTARSAVAAAVVATVLAAGAALGLLAPTADPSRPMPQTPDAPADDPLPPGAVARIGTNPFRQPGWRKHVFYAPDGKTVIVTDEENKVRAWDVAAGRVLRELEVPKSRFDDADFAPGTGLLALLGTHWTDLAKGEYEMRGWLIDTAGWKVAHTLRMPDVRHSVAHVIRITPDGRRAFTLLDGDLRVWDAKTGDELLRQKVRPRGPDTMAVSPDGKTVVFGRYDLSVWEWETGGEPKPFIPIGGAGTEKIAFASDGKTLYVHNFSGGLFRLWDVPSGRQVGTLDVGGHPASLSFSPDGRTLAVGFGNTGRVGGRPTAISLWDVAAGKEVGRLPLGRAFIGQASWSPDGTKLAAGSAYRVYAWDVKAGKPLGPARQGHEGAISAFAFGPDGTLFTASDDHTVRSWDAAGRPGLELAHDYWVRDVAVSPDGALVAGSALRNDLRVWDAKTGRPRFKLLGNGDMGGTRRVRFTSNGARLIAWGDDEVLRVWDTRNGKLLAEHSTRPPGEAEDPDNPAAEQIRQLRSMAGIGDVSPDGSFLAIGTRSGVRFIDPVTGTERQTLDIGTDGVARIAFSPDGKRLVVAGQAKRIRTTLPDGRTRSSTANEYPISVWDLTTRKQVWAATAEGFWPSIAISPDGERVAGVSLIEDKPSIVRLWDAGTGADAGRIELPLAADKVAFDRTGKRLAVSFRDTTAMVYDVASALKPAPPK